jgi:hypothetical protein
MRPAFLVDLFDPSAGQPQTGHRAGVVTVPQPAPSRELRLDDDIDEDEDDDLDDDDDFKDDDDEGDDEDGEADDPEEGETWQVARFG